MGEWKDNQLILTENFIYSDKKTQQRIWKIKKVKENTYQGEASDIVGLAHGKQSGNALHWTYVMDLEVDGKHYHINFDDWMYLVTPKRLINKTSMSKFGFDVGDVTLTIEKNN